MLSIFFENNQNFLWLWLVYSMNINLDLGFVLTVVFGVISLFGIFLGWKAWNRPKISFVAENSIILANLTHSNFEISVRYKEDEVSNNLILISAHLVNDGNVDIDVRDVEEPITINLPESAKWMSFEVINNKHGMKICEDLDSNSLKLNIGLWKKREGFKFDALIAFDNEDVLVGRKKIFDEFIISSRIKGLDNVNILNLGETRTYKSKFSKILKLFIIPIIGSGFYIFLGLILVFGVLNKNRYDLKVYKDNEVINLKVENGEPKFYQGALLLNNNEQKTHDLKLVAEKVKDAKNDKIIGFITILMGFIMFIILTYKDIKSYMLKKKIDRN